MEIMILIVIPTLIVLIYATIDLIFKEIKSKDGGVR